ncbi:MAG: hypothetical protein JXQ73_06905 [Phycisphaerae bacterium]|nr:hypothetical protein [Phycisphaerae bacterium]
MDRRLLPVTIAGTGSFLPNDPIPNDKIDDVLGPLDKAPTRVQSFIKAGGNAMLGDSGIDYRHFAVDPETHDLTHTFATLAEEAARHALDDAGMTPDEIELLLLSSPTYDYGTPPTSTILQERLGIESCAEMEIHSNCAGVGKSVQVAFDALRAGRYRTALVTYPQLSSVYLRSCFFNQAKVTKAQAALRYILADGSGALVLKALDDDARDADGFAPHEVLGTYVESIGGRLPPAMTAGAGAADLVAYRNQALVVYENGLHHLDQDFSCVTRNAGRRLLEGGMRMYESLGIDPKTITHHVGSIPTKQLYEDNIELFKEWFSATREQIQFLARKTGYCGGASILIHFDQMVRHGEIRPGDLVGLYSVESSKWMSAGFVVRW